MVLFIILIQFILQYSIRLYVLFRMYKKLYNLPSFYFQEMERNG